jgi:glycosyltransferase involved in cell wall biosynthesis
MMGLDMHAMLIDFTFFAYTVPLANALSELCEVTLLLPDRAPGHYQARVSERVKLHPFHKPRLRYPTSLFMVRSIFKAINQIKPQVVHQIASNLWFNMALPFFPDVPLVATIHDARRHPGDKGSIPLFFKQRRWQWASQVIVHSESIKQQMLELDPTLDGRLHIVPHGWYDFYKAWSADEKADAEETPTVLFFGKIWEYKGLQYLIEAEPLITSQVPNARIVIAGRGEPFEKYERMMVNKDHFIVHNYHIPDEMVASLFDQASVVALPYTEASQSGILAIACAFGKPVVASAVGGIPEVVDHEKTGYLVPPGDSRSLAEAIITLLQDRDLREQMGREALEKAESELSWPAVAQQTLRVYQQALNAS